MSPATSAGSFRERLDADPDWALREGSLHFEEKGAVQETLRAITKRLDELGVAYVVAGGMALFRHGFRRFTEDVDLLVTRDGLARIHDQLEGLGYVHVFKGSKKLRDTRTGVQIDFLIAGDYPGDGKPKPVAFPDPAQAGIDIGGMRVVALPKLVELKLASGMTGGVSRLKDFADVVELIRALAIPRAFGEQLNAYVQPKFFELWDGLLNSPSEVES
jgi:hypothetical protein